MRGIIEEQTERVAEQIGGGGALLIAPGVRGLLVDALGVKPRERIEERRSKSSPSAAARGYSSNCPGRVCLARISRPALATRSVRFGSGFVAASP